jgi:protein TonB
MDRGSDDFFPSELLSQPQVPLSGITLKLAPGAPPNDSYVVRLTLLIDEAGYVLHLIPQFDSSVPPQYVQAAVEAFSNARFTPGLLDGQPVRTRMKLEVTFDGPASEAGDPEDGAKEPT